MTLQLAIEILREKIIGAPDLSDTLKKDTSGKTEEIASYSDQLFDRCLSSTEEKSKEGKPGRYLETTLT